MEIITTPEALLGRICQIMQQDIQTVKSKSRLAILVLTRQYYNYIGSEFYKFDLGNLGSAIGARDHATIIHSIKSLKEKISINEQYTIRFLDKIMEQLNLKIDDGYNYQRLFVAYNKTLKENEILKKENEKLSILYKKLPILEAQIKLYKAGK